ncbi:MAG: sulfatase [Verrucomicrobia bacterium]|nr:sulfatase [Verrucomicrobiota bacterium]
MKILLALGVALMASLPATGAEVARPNVLFIAVDDLRTNLGCYGDAVATTPNIDALATRGGRFTRAYCQESVCNPSRQSLLTGRRPDTIRVWDLKTHFRQTSPGVVTLPEHFKTHGYFAQSFGKIFHGEAPMADPRSWSVPEQLEYIAKRDDYQLPENREPRRTQKAAATEFQGESDDDYPDGKVAAGAVAALRGFATTRTGQPFFLAVGFMKPHLPFTAPKRYWDLYDRVAIPPPAQPAPPRGAPALALHDSTELRGYYDMPKVEAFTAAATSFTDAQVGRVIAELTRVGLAANTIVVLWSDHGFHLGEHGLWAKTTNYESDTRVPLIFARPGTATGGTACPSLVELLDVFPTLVDLCGLPPPSGLEGVSLKTWLDHPAAPGRPAAFSQFPRPWTYRAEPAHMGYAVRTATHRYVEWRRFGTRNVVARELYAYQGEELFESENLAERPDEMERLRSMAALLPTGASGGTGRVP